ncbi:protein cereblon-like isoform X2 [Mizuhopecten yessoensis]|uniref:protein cereblon-like isoform X2 n=1 Tax=Mizuhopecten yessoensis TaxID=6573 RepID=UPI000B459E22|nr:protein cereblon-like isoform X2 [Mizuhopecten yessoensis]
MHSTKWQPPVTDYLLCRKCGHEVVRAANLINIPSKVALRQRNSTFGGVPEILIQQFKNPHDNSFEVITTRKADVLEDLQKYSDDTWFPNYSWWITKCPHCGQHMGWTYRINSQGTSTDGRPEQFYGLVLDNLLPQQEAETLIHFPKAYGF